MPEIVQNGTKTYHVEHLGGLGPEIVQNGTKTDHLEAWAALGPKCSKMVPKLSIWALNDTLRRVGALNGTPRQGRETCFKRHPPSRREAIPSGKLFRMEAI